MITENTLHAEDKMRQVVDDVSINLSNNSNSYEDLFISETVSETNKFTGQNTTFKNDKNIESDRPTCRTGIGILMDLPLKIMNGVTDLLNFQSSPSPESEIPAKRPYSPKPHHAKQTPTDVARGRGRGRGRSQLRRSGVSQTRHRQERIRQRLSADIRDDLNGLDLQDQYIDDEVPSTPCVDETGQRIRYSADGPEAEPGASRFPFSVRFCNIKRKKPKQRNKQGSISDNCKVRYIPEKTIDVGGASDEEGTESERIRRRRLQSDLSVDSEDSYCIVFENGSELDYETDCRLTSEDDDDDESNDDCGETFKVNNRLKSSIDCNLTIFFTLLITDGQIFSTSCYPHDDSVELRLQSRS